MTTWLPTETEIEQLPDGVRRYIRALEADRDPEKMVSTLILLRDQVDKLGDRLATMHAGVVMANEALMGVLVAG